MPFLIRSFYDDESRREGPKPLMDVGPATGIFYFRSQLGEPAPPMLAPPLVSSSPEPGKALVLTHSSKVPLPTLYRSFVTFADGDTTPSVRDATMFRTANTGATNITSLRDGREGQRITILFADANTTVTDGGNLRLAGNFTSTADDVLELVYDGEAWYELKRSAN